MTIEIKNELGYTELIIEEAKFYDDDYQMLMLKECALDGVLPVVAYGEDDISRYIYDVTGMQSLCSVNEHMPLLEVHIQELASQLLQVMKGVKQHMLDVNKLLLDPKYIFKRGEQYHFCYYPLHETKITESFHLLTEYFVKVIDYDEIDTVRMVGNLHKNTMDEHYELSEVLSRCTQISHQVAKNECMQEPEKVAESIHAINDIWAQEIDDQKEPKAHKEIDQSQKSFKYIFPQDGHITSMIKESAISKWWGKSHSPFPTGQKKVKNHKDACAKWGDWDDLLNEKI